MRERETERRAAAGRLGMLHVSEGPPRSRWAGHAITERLRAVTELTLIIRCHGETLSCVEIGVGADASHVIRGPRGSVR